MTYVFVRVGRSVVRSVSTDVVRGEIRVFMNDE